MDRWNPQINWKENTMKWKVGSRVIEITGLQEAQPKKEISSLFHLGSYVEEISAQLNAKDITEGTCFYCSD